MVKLLKFFFVIVSLFILTPVQAIASTSSSCSQYVMCSDLEAYHDDTIDTINDYLDDLATDYETFLENQLWTDGILLSLPSFQEQLSMSETKNSEILATLDDYQHTDDVKREIEGQKVKAVLEHQPSENGVCKKATIVGAVNSARQRGNIRMAQSMRTMQHIATGSSPEISDRASFVRSQKEHALCRYADRADANGGMEAFCGPTQPSEENLERANLGSLNSKNTLDQDDQEALERHTQSMFLTNRPNPVNSDLITQDSFKVAYMDHRSVLSRELLGSYCFLKTYQTKMDGSPETYPYLLALLREMEVPQEVIDRKLGPDPASSPDVSGPSLFTQREVMTWAVNHPLYGKELMEDKNNIQRQANVVKSYQISTLYDNLEMMHCNQMMASQMFVDELLPYGVDLQERLNSQKIVQAPKHGPIELVEQNISSTQQEGL